MLERKVRLVEALFENLDTEIKTFQTETKLHCITGCGKCCTKPNIDASPLEFLPWAFQLFLNGQAEIILAKLNTESTSICHIYQPFSLENIESGSCSNYKYRGLICRLFGFGANTDKYGALRLATCKRIKEEQQTNYTATVTAIADGLSVPIFTAYYQRLNQIDFHMGNTILPINQALKRAIEEVLQYYAYRPLPDGFAHAG